MLNFQVGILIDQKEQLQYRPGNLIDFQLLLMQIKIKISLGIILIMESKTQKIRSMKLLRIFY